MISANAPSSYVSQKQTIIPVKRQRNFNPTLYPRVRLLTIMKTGTHLLEKLLTLLGYPEAALGPPHHAYYHGCHPIDYSKKNIILIRDPRDVMASLVRHVDSYFHAKLHNIPTPINGGLIGTKQDLQNWEMKSYDERLMDAITHNNQTGYDFIWANKKQWETVESLQPLLKNKPENFIMVRFEDIVGSKGGGSDEKQAKEIERIAKFVGLPHNPDLIDYVQQNVFGSTVTFKKGQIGNWKKNFKSEHVKAFLPRQQKYLEFFGYEKDDSWAEKYL